jgi:hypothetical protein
MEIKIKIKNLNFILYLKKTNKKTNKKKTKQTNKQIEQKNRGGRSPPFWPRV